MIKIELEHEQKPIGKVRIFNLRRHKQATQTSNREKIYLTVRGAAEAEEFYPIVIDGLNETVTIRKEIFELMGFSVKVS